MSIVFNPKKYHEQLLFKGKKGMQRFAPVSPPDISKPQDLVEVSWYPKDPLVTPVETTLLPSPFVQPDENPGGLLAPRFRIMDQGNSPAQPGENYAPDVPQFDQLMSLAVGEKVLNTCEQALGRIVPWGFGDPQLWIYVRRQEEPNSGYTRGNPKSSDPDSQHGRVELDYFTDMLTGQTLQGSQAADITAHECTHATTDGIRDLYLESFSPDSQAFSEGNADIGAMILALNTPSVLSQDIGETNGNLSQYNLISSIGAQFGQGMADDMYAPPSAKPFIRSAFNDPQTFKDTDWRKLPFIDSNDGPGSEPHSYSRVWSGAWYDSLVNVYNLLRNSYGLSPDKALYQAGHVMSDVALRAMEFSPIGDMSFDEMALAYLKAVKTDFGANGIGAEYRRCIEQAFSGRSILTQNQIDDWNKQEASLPNITLDSKTADSGSAQTWLENHASQLASFDPDLSQVLPQLQFKEIYSNRLGETFVNFAYKKTIALEDSDFTGPDLAQYKDQFKGTQFDIWGGLTLGFDSNGKLFAFTHDTIPSSEKSDDKDYILLLISQGMIQGDSNAVEPGWNRLSHYKAIHMRGAVVMEDGKKYIRRIQTIM